VSQPLFNFPFQQPIPSFLSIKEALKKGNVPIQISGFGGSSNKAFWVTLLYKTTPQSLLLVTESMEEAQSLFFDLQFFADLFKEDKDSIRLFPGGETLPYEKNSPSLECRITRMETLYHLLGQNRSIVITTIPSLCQGTLPRRVFETGLFPIRVHDSFPQETLLSHLEELGYVISTTVHQIGECAVRGGIIDIFTPAFKNPIRLEYWDDTIDSIRVFDPVTQRSTETIPSAKIIPIRELLLKKEYLQDGWEEFNKRGHSLGLSPYQIELQWNHLIQKPPRPGLEILAPFLTPLKTLFDFMPGDCLVLWDEWTQLEKQTEDFFHEANKAYQALLQEGLVLPLPEELFHQPLAQLSSQHTQLYLESISLSSGRAKTSLSTEFRSTQSLGFQQKGASFSTQLERLQAFRGKNLCLLVCRTPTQQKRLRELFAENHLPTLSVDSSDQENLFSQKEQNPSPSFSYNTGSKLPPPTPFPLVLLMGDLSNGFLAPQESLLVITEEEFLGHRVKHRPTSKSKLSPFLPALEELEPRDWVVHLQHGIGQYIGLERLNIQGIQKEFMLIQYAGKDKLYVPLEHLDQVQPYSGVEGASPQMDRLGGTTWAKTKQKVKRELEEMAEELLQLYATREITEGYTYPPDTTLSREFESTFEYEETPDQLRAIQDVKKDLERDRPMDRLICGDVGYGKTEVALRAAFKAVEESKQVAVLAPTTLLAHQHFQTFTQRFNAFPVRVEMLSRFRSPREQKEIIKGIRKGEVDIIIGTHRLLQKDVQFQDLGLVVIDEEQRFGVTHKEHLKQLRTHVDVLTLTATPIPRTLQFSLLGARDISLIETPPADRLAIHTLTVPFEQKIIQEGIQRELDRGGQVFFVHNRVQSIERMATFLKNLFPEVSIGIAHGQMAERALEQVMRRFIQKDCQILVCTSIVESGLDIPDANTIFINRADQFGLSELYQLRGRVGRSGYQAYAYLLIPQGRILTSEAKKRLRALQEFTELGAGFRIAARDLEIRGAGSLLGKKQSGHIAALGFEFYLQMIENTVKQLKGEKVEEELEPNLDLNVSAYLPEEYIPDTHQRLSIYKRLSSVADEHELKKLKEELIDRFGPIHEAAQHLLQVMELKMDCKTLRILRMDSQEKGFRITLDPSHRVSQEGFTHLMDQYQEKIRFHSEYCFEILTERKNWEEEMHHIKTCLHVLRLH
jgi:transcription-repair coupling factor (superfamily II helicase)